MSAWDLAVANEILKHVYGHALNCPCQFPREQAALKARLLAKYSLSEKQPHAYDATKYAPVHHPNLVDRMLEGDWYRGNSLLRILAQAQEGA